MKQEKRSTLFQHSPVDENLTVLTNTDEISSVPFVNAAGMKMKEVKFAVTPLMSTYTLFKINVVGRLRRWRIGLYRSYCRPNTSTRRQPIQLRVYTVKGASGQGSLALSVAKKRWSISRNILTLHTRWASVTWWLFLTSALGNGKLGSHHLPDDALLCDERTATSSAKKRIAYTVAHELAHQWFGNLVTMKWWNDIWLNEGFATFVGWLAIDHLFPEWDIWTGYITEVLSGALGLDGLRSSHPIDVPVRIGSEALEVLDAISYKKGSSIIRMLNNFLGGDVFMNGVRSYLKEFQYKNAVTADLWRHLALSSGLDIPTLMQAWTDKTGYPLIIVESEVYDDEAKTLTVTLSQSRFLSGGELKPEEDAVTWWVPLTVATHLTGKSSESRVFSAKNGIITFPYDAAENSFWKLNVNGSGVYRVKYGNTQVANISRTLQLSLDNFTAGDRMMFVADAYALTSAGLGDIKNVLDLIQGMSKETDFNVLTQISSTLATLKSITYKESALIRDGLKSLGKAVFSPLVKSLGFEFSVEEEYFTGQKRILAISVASGCGEEFVISELRSRFDKFIAGDLQALHPELRSTAMNLLSAMHRLTL
ncbi:zincin [Rhizoclosmatium globosum]|uniref:Zincin n=1 Tax=Rhizoclosmatium globosum TaxID=329046 RepID=A0A1Y2CMN5_9FUNG|nr:zincin [Rhizoclosmatium globosum]|eukprot:ORY48186.1 zincin [Rhizoclosmatium globosum]